MLHEATTAPSRPSPAMPLRVMHFVTGGFSGATQVAVDLCHSAGPQQQAVLVLRRKRNTDAARVQALRDKGLQVHMVPGWSHLATIAALYRLCRQIKPDVLVAHGFSDHIWGRAAGLLARVPQLVHVEHNTRERYNALRLWQSRWLARHTARFVGVSEGVRQRLVELGFPAERCVAIPNGIDHSRFKAGGDMPIAQRQACIVMSARFARQKDQLSLIRAIGLLNERGLRMPLKLAGAGRASYRQAAEREVRRLGLEAQVEFLGHSGELPQLLMRSAVYVLSTHWEGMPLALVEGMAAGCACVASDVPGIEGVIEHERSGLLVPESDPAALADALERLFCEPELAQRVATAGRARAMESFSLDLMRLRYQALLASL